MRRFVGVLAAAGIAVSALFAQAQYGSLSGRALDSSGAVIPGVSIRIVNAETGHALTVTTGPDGAYQAPQLLPGVYDIRVEHAGFKLKKARESVIVIGQVDHVPPGKSEEATIIFLDDTARAEYQGYSRVIRLRGRYVPLSALLNDVPYAMKVATPRSELGGEMIAATFLSKVVRLISRLTGGAG